MKANKMPWIQRTSADDAFIAWALWLAPAVLPPCIAGSLQAAKYNPAVMREQARPEQGACAKRNDGGIKKPGARPGFFDFIRVA
ncbi:hypothetical protein J2Z50_001732 [Ensifer mexicanus]|nr:hypothetical protein [Sinorhizobium mexicanum]